MNVLCPLSWQPDSGTIMIIVYDFTLILIDGSNNEFKALNISNEMIEISQALSSKKTVINYFRILLIPE